MFITCICGSKEFLLGKQYEVTSYQEEICSIYTGKNSKYNLISKQMKYNAIKSEDGRVYDNCGKGYYFIEEINNKMGRHKFKLSDD